MAAHHSRCSLFVTMVILFSVFTGHDGENNYILATHYMKDYCGTTFDMSQIALNEEIMLEMAPVAYQMQNIVCDMTIVSPNHKLLFKFESADIDYCDTNSIQLFGQSTTASDVISRQICQYRKDDVYTTPGDTGILRLTATWPGTYGGFKLHITSFYSYAASEPSCKSGYFQCSTTSRCIKSNLECNTRDNCGDNSDEYEECHEDDNSVAIIVGSVIGILVFILLIIGIVCCCIQCNKTKTVNKGRVHATNTGYPPAATSHPNGYPAAGPTPSPFTVTHTTGPYPSAPPPPYSRVGPGFVNGQPLRAPQPAPQSDLIPPPALYIPPYAERH